MTEQPPLLAATPVLSSALQGLRLEGAIFFRSELTEPFAFESTPLALADRLHPALGRSQRQLRGRGCRPFQRQPEPDGHPPARARADRGSPGPSRVGAGGGPRVDGGPARSRPGPGAVASPRLTRAQVDGRRPRRRGGGLPLLARRPVPPTPRPLAHPVLDGVGHALGRWAPG